MDINGTLFIILCIVALIAGTVCYKAYLKNNREMKQIEVISILSVQETERMVVFVDLIKKQLRNLPRK